MRTVARIVPWGTPISSWADEDVVPEAGLEVALHLGQVEVRAGALGEQRLRVVERVERQVEDAGRHRVAVHQHVLLVQVPPAGAHEEGRERVAEAVLLAAAAERDGAVHRVAQVDLALDRVLPGGRVGVLEVRHEDLGARVEGVDDHLAVDRAGDLGAAVLQVGRARGPPARRGHRGCERSRGGSPVPLRRRAWRRAGRAARAARVAWARRRGAASRPARAPRA